MQSAFEHSAQRAAVKAVEDRLAHNDRVRKQASQRRMIGTLGSWLVGLAILAAIGYWLYGRLEPRQGHVRQDRVYGDNSSVTSRPSEGPRPQAGPKRQDDRKATPKRNVRPIGNR